MAFVYPKSAVLKEIAQDKIPVLTQDDILFKFLPMVSKDTDLVAWEQKDNYVGLQGVRGIGGQPGRVARVGGKRYIVQPGYYGEHITLDEQELTRRRAFGTFNQPIDISDLVMDAQDQLLSRRIDRIRYIGWTLLSSGTFSVTHPETGQVLHTDTFSLQTATALVNWATAGSATPLKDFRALQLLSRGSSTSFNAKAQVVMNRKEFNKLVANTNTSDLAGRRTSGLQTVLTLDEINRVLLGEDLPQIVVYDEGYLNDAGTFVPFIPDEKVIVVGVRPGNAPIGEYVMTRNVNNEGLEAGAYTAVIDTGASAGAAQQIPRKVDVHDGHNGAPTMEFPGAVVVMDTTP
jgi:hypothetical protein